MGETKNCSLIKLPFWILSKTKTKTSFNKLKRLFSNQRFLVVAVLLVFVSISLYMYVTLTNFVLLLCSFLVLFTVFTTVYVLVSNKRKFKNNDETITHQPITDEAVMIDLDSILDLDPVDSSQEATTSKTLGKNKQRKMKWSMRKAKQRIENDDRNMIVYPAELTNFTVNLNGVECPICFEGMAVGTELVYLNCHPKHSICSSCADKSFKNENFTCPFCRRQLL